MTEPTQETWRPDFATVVAIAVIVFALANVAHEGVGHGGACVLVGGRPVVLSSVHFECDEATLTGGGVRLLAAGGTLLNLLLAGAALAGFKIIRRNGHGRWFLWLLATVNLFQAAGYLLFSGIGDIGDWAVVIHGNHPAFAWRAGMAVVGAFAYLAIARAAAGWLALLVDGEGRVARARRLAVPSYVAGGMLYCVAGLFNPVGPLLVLISGAAASFGGTSGLLWFHEWLRGEKIPISPAPVLVLARRPAWVVTGVVTALIFVVVLGRGIRL